MHDKLVLALFEVMLFYNTEKSSNMDVNLIVNSIFSQNEP